MYSIWFSSPMSGELLEVKVKDLKDAQFTWMLLDEQFEMVSAKP